MALLGSKAVISDSLDTIFFHTIAQIVAIAQLILTIGITLLGGKTIPFDSLGIIFFHAIAIIIAIGKHPLCAVVALLGSLTYSLKHSRTIDECIIVGTIVYTKPIYGIAVPLFCGKAVISGGLSFILENTLAKVIAVGQTILRIDIALLGRPAEPLESLIIIFFHAHTHIIAIGKIVLRGRLAKLGSLAIPLHGLLLCFRIIYIGTKAAVTHSQHSLCTT